MAGQAQEPMAFEDVAVLLSRAEWDALTAEQRELYRDVLSDTYELLTSLGYPGPKPDVLHRLERGEEPWISSSRGEQQHPDPVGWNPHPGWGQGFLLHPRGCGEVRIPGHTESWLEEPSSDWWPRSSGFQGLETLFPAGWSTLWCLQDRNFQKFGCHKGRSKAPSEAAGFGVGSQTQPWPVKEEVEDKPELMEDLTHSETFPLHSTMEQQRLHPREQLWDGPGQRNHGNAQNHGHTSGEATLTPGTQGLRLEELRAAAAKDHGYCLRSEGPPCAPQPCSLREHSYCQQLPAGESHEAEGSREGRRRSKAGRTRKAGRNRKAGRKREVSSLQAVRRLLACRQCHGRRTFRRAREILRRYQPYWRLGFPWRGHSSSGSDTTQGMNPEVCPPMDAVAPRQLQSAGNAEGVTLDTQRGPEGILGTEGSPPALSLDAGVREGAKPLEHPGATQELEGCTEGQKLQEVSLQDVFRNVLKAVRYILDSICEKLELQGVPQGKSIWPIVIQIDNLTEKKKL